MNNMNNIAYKVVGNGYRSVALCHNSRYSLYYGVGSTVLATPNTLGIMCFSSWRQAYRFARMVSWRGHYRILKIQGITRLQTPISVCRSLQDFHLDLYYANRYHDSAIPPIGTVCFKSVKVLKEINNE